MSQRQRTATLTDKEVGQLLAAPTVYHPESVESLVLLPLLVSQLRKQSLFTGLRAVGGLVFLIGIPVSLWLALRTDSIIFIYLFGIWVVWWICLFGKQALSEEERVRGALTIVNRQLDADGRAELLPDTLALLANIHKPRPGTEAAQCLERIHQQVIERLPYLLADGARSLAPAQRAYLRQEWLQLESNPKGQVAALLTLASARDREAVPLARALLAQTTNDAVREAAQELLAAMEQ
jgi:hypothetical protein